MAKGRAPYFPFYPDDWTSDDGLAACSIGAQGLWIYMLCVMHRSPKPGYLLNANGERFPEDRLRMARNIPDELFSVLISELETMAVFSRTEDGTIYSRRMVRDFSQRKEWCKWQKNHRRKNGLCQANVRSMSVSSPSPFPSPSPILNSKAIAHQKPMSDPEFARFWNEYPRRVSQQAAWRAWRKVAAESAAILTGLDAWKKCDQWAELQYVPYPATFLNQRRWETPPTKGETRCSPVVGRGPVASDYGVRVNPEALKRIQERERLRAELESRRP